MSEITADKIVANAVSSGDIIANAVSITDLRPEHTDNTSELDETQSAYKWLFLLLAVAVNAALAVWAGIWLLVAAWAWKLSLMHLAILLFCLFWAVVWGDLLKRA